MGFIISVCNNNKGGAGKTTASVNLADALGRDGRIVNFLSREFRYLDF